MFPTKKKIPKNNKNKNKNKNNIIKIKKPSQLI